jgi:hypothetical protein
VVETGLTIALEFFSPRGEKMKLSLGEKIFGVTMFLCFAAGGVCMLVSALRYDIFYLIRVAACCLGAWIMASQLWSFWLEDWWRDKYN